MPAPFNPLVTRFPAAPGGISPFAENTLEGQIGYPIPTGWLTYFNDFFTYTAGDWVVTETDAGATEALTAGDGGLLLITNTAADNDLVALQKTPAAFLLDASKYAYFAMRFKVSDATQSDIAVGLQIVDTTPLDVSDGIYFLKADGAATVDIIVRKNASTGSNSATAIASLADDTFVTLAWLYDPTAQRVYYAVNGVILGSLSASSTYFPDAILTPSFAIQNGEGVAKTMTVDYILATKAR